MTDLVRATLVHSGLPLRPDGRPLILPSVAFACEPPTATLDRDGDLVVGYDDLEFTGGWVNGNWGPLGIGGGHIAGRGGSSSHHGSTKAGEIHPYSGNENGEFGGAEDLMDFLERAMLIANVDAKIPQALEILNLLNEDPHGWDIETVQEWAEASDAGLTEGQISDVSDEIWEMVRGMNGIEFDLHTYVTNGADGVVKAIHDDVQINGISDEPRPATVRLVRGSRTTREDLLYLRTGYRDDPDFDVENTEGENGEDRETSLLALARRHFGDAYVGRGINTIDDGVTGGWTWVIVEPYGFHDPWED